MNLNDLKRAIIAEFDLLGLEPPLVRIVKTEVEYFERAKQAVLEIEVLGANADILEEVLAIITDEGLTIGRRFNGELWGEYIIINKI